MALSCGICCQEMTFLCQDVGQCMVRGTNVLIQVICIIDMTI